VSGEVRITGARVKSTPTGYRLVLLLDPAPDTYWQSAFPKIYSTIVDAEKREAHLDGPTLEVSIKGSDRLEAVSSPVRDAVGRTNEAWAKWRIDQEETAERVREQVAADAATLKRLQDEAANLSF